MKKLMIAVLLLAGCDENLREEEDPIVAECERLGEVFDAAVQACIKCGQGATSPDTCQAVCAEAPKAQQRMLDYCLSEYRKAKGAAQK